MGGSLSGTTLIKNIGEVSPWAIIFTGLFGPVIVLLFAALIEVLAMPAMAGLLIMVGVSMIKTHCIQTVWNTSSVPVTIMLITFAEAKGSVVIIRLRDREEVGSTFMRIIERYSGALKAQGNMLMLTGLIEHVLEQLEKTELIELIGEENILPAEPRFGAGVNRAVEAAETWINQEKSIS